jgi:hypothetical protein
MVDPGRATVKTRGDAGESRGPVCRVGSL